MTWTATVWKPASLQGDGFYLGGFLGGAVHDGRLVGNDTDGNKTLGRARSITSVSKRVIRSRPFTVLRLTSRISPMRTRPRTIPV
jgi:hypothetical protein